MAKYVFEVIEECNKIKEKAGKIAFLQQHNSGALSDILRGTFDDRVEWLLPKGPVPFTPNRPESTPSNLLKECAKFAYLVKGGKGPNLNAPRREKIFIGILEAIHPKDAYLVVDMINKKAPKGINRQLVKEAFSHLLADT